MEFLHEGIDMSHTVDQIKYQNSLSKYSKSIPHVQLYRGYLINLVSPFATPLILTVEDLVVEKTNALLNESNTKLLGCLKHLRVILATTRCSDVLRT